MQRPVFYIASVLVVTKGYLAPAYYVTTNGGVSVYVGYEHLPVMVQKWLVDHNHSDYVHQLVSTDSLTVMLFTDGRLN